MRATTFALIVLGAAAAAAQESPASLTVAMYAPSAAFTDSAARLAYVQGLAKAIQQKTGVPTTGKVFVRLADLLGAKPEFAVVDGQCLAARSLGLVLATGTIGGETAQTWGLYARGDSSATALKGKKLAYVRTGCRDGDFLDNALLDGEVKSSSFFGGLVDRPDVAGAVVAVRDYRAADAVFAPAAQAHGLARVYQAGPVPNPGFVALNKATPPTLVEQVRAAVLGYGGGGGIDAWRSAISYGGLAGRMGARPKRPVFAAPELIRMDETDVLQVPPVRFEQAAIKQHFWEPAARPGSP